MTFRFENVTKRFRPRVSDLSVFNNILIYTGVTRAEIMSDSRKQRVADARTVAMTQFRHRGESLNEIAERFNRDHTTVIYNLRKSIELIAENRHYSTMLEAIFDEATAKQEASHD